MKGDSESWRRIEEIFHEALQRPPEERDRFLSRRCAGEPELRREVESLLAMDEGSGGWIDDTEPFRGSARQLAEHLSEGRLSDGDDGRRIGPYRLLREIGRGGMGTVYLAERADEHFRQRVALKVIKRGMDTDTVVERFQRERQILADLDHPNIARLLDGGATPEDLPFLVLELIDGEPLIRYCDRRRLSIEDRLALFLQVCAAVHYAHQNLVVHRDLKPSNVLVTEAGVPKLLDFGTAKLLAPSHGATLTADGMRLLTPGYASPEQVEGGAITTASDIYGLGALLYELLTGRGTHRVRNRQARERARAACEDAPEPPSAAVQRFGDDAPDEISATEIAQARGTQPARLCRRLQGDLDRIVLMALRREPERRYSSAEQLAQDLRWHLEGRPVQARADTLGYRTGRLLRRHRGLATSIALVLVLLLTFALLMMRQSVAVASQRDRAEFERDKAHEVSTFLVDLLANAAPEASETAGPVPRQLIERGVARVRREYTRRPEVQAALLEALGKTLREMGLLDEAEPLLEDALATRSDLLGDQHLDTATSLHELGALYTAQGRPGQARGLLEQGLAIRESALGGDHPEVARSLSALADLAAIEGDQEEARALVMRALAIRQAALSPTHPDTAQSFHDLGLMAYVRGDLEHAVELLEKGRDIRLRVYGSEHPETGDSLHDLGLVHFRSGRPTVGEPLCRRALEIYQVALGSHHPHVAAAADCIARIRLFQEDYATAEPFYLQALDVRKEVFGKDHFQVGISLHNLGLLYLRSGDLERAEPLLRRALSIQEIGLGPDHPFVALALHYLGQVARQRGDLATAESSLERALEIRRAAFGLEHPHVAKDLGALALVYRDRGDLEQAAELLSQAQDMSEAILGKEHPELASLLMDCAQLQIQRGLPQEARALATRVLAIRLDALGEDHPATVRARRLLSSIPPQDQIADNTFQPKVLPQDERPRR